MVRLVRLLMLNEHGSEGVVHLLVCSMIHAEVIHLRPMHGLSNGIRTDQCRYDLQTCESS